MNKTCLGIIIFGIWYFVFCISNVNASEVYYLHQDHLGSTSAVTDQEGKVISQEVYYPYGETRSKMSDAGYQMLEKQYTGQVSDQDQTGLYYYNARYYNPEIAKFTQVDKSGEGLNKYLYALNNPLRFNDPSGNQTDTTIPPPTGIIGGQTLQTWTGPITQYPYGGTPDPGGFYRTFTTVLAGSVLAPAAAACLTNPMCSAVVAKIATVVDIADTTVDTAQCVGGDTSACGYVANPIPGAGLGDEVAELASDVSNLSDEIITVYHLTDSESALDIAENGLFGFYRRGTLFKDINIASSVFNGNPINPKFDRMLELEVPRSLLADDFVLKPGDDLYEEVFSINSPLPEGQYPKYLDLIETNRKFRDAYKSELNLRESWFKPTYLSPDHLKEIYRRAK